MSSTVELDALIIRNLEEIEQGYERIMGDIQRRLDEEAGEIFENVAEKSGWVTFATELDEDFWLTKSAWQMGEGPADKADHYLAVRLDCDSKGPDVSWAQTFVGGQGSRLLFVIGSDAYSESKWLRFLKQDEASEVLRRLTKKSRFRFEPDNKSEPLALPVLIDQEKLAEAFAGEIDFEEALAPLTEALNEIIAHEALLHELAGLAREGDE